MKQYAVIGCGRFGVSVAKTLYDLGNDVLAIDRNEERVQEASEFVTHAVQADIMDENVLKELGIRNFDVVIVAIGSDLEASILATLIAKELGVGLVIAKAQSELHGKVLLKIGADKIIFPERDMGIRVGHNLVASNILDFIELSPDYSIMEITAIPKWENKTLKQLKLPTNYGLNIMAIKRGDYINVSPYADDKILKNDILVVIGSTEDIKKIEKSSGE
ncbi:potassium channel family protein [Anaerosalibacter massiliensis]|uniref:TrkA family potassium uptake protein n=1 Tax=Anaerosalibacter massiliensis TaxID=1347392 RepID=A0A9X2S7Y5_9FIRM|nr:TrkA family potassium uptake protein [Anaerosalibacter massiliensis]MCR2045257.1 TrkA family potassium uptake protein [Anaerosalibacter massiliensis]